MQPNQHRPTGEGSHDAFDAHYWEERYRTGAGASRHAPSPSLLMEAQGLVPGAALDAGCGWGADALWLAARGWSVTAVDVSRTAVDQARQAAEAADATATGAVAWVAADLTTWEPERDFDLVTSHYVHAPGPPSALFARLASWVAPGGTLLVVGHGYTPGQHSHAHAGHGKDERSEDPGSPLEAARHRLDAVTSVLPASEWTIVVAEPRTHILARPGGGSVSLDDIVVKAQRHQPAPRQG